MGVEHSRVGLSCGVEDGQIIEALVVGQEDKYILAPEKGGFLLGQGHVLHLLDIVGERSVHNHVDRPPRPDEVCHSIIVHIGSHFALPVEGQAVVKDQSFDILLLLVAKKKVMRSVAVLLKFAGVVAVEEFAYTFLETVSDEGELVVLHFFAQGFSVVLGPVVVGITGVLKLYFTFTPLRLGVVLVSVPLLASSVVLIHVGLFPQPIIKAMRVLAGLTVVRGVDEATVFSLAVVAVVALVVVGTHGDILNY